VEVRDVLNDIFGGGDVAGDILDYHREGGFCRNLWYDGGHVVHIATDRRRQSPLVVGLLGSAWQVLTAEVFKMLERILSFAASFLMVTFPKGIGKVLVCDTSRNDAI
jgi:hypothetical protein